MVSESKGFSHISVSPEEEDDLVIQAGSVAPSQGAPDPAPEHGGEDGAMRGAQDAGAEPADAAEASVARAQAAPESDAPRNHPNGRTERKASSGTTLEDLEGSKMSALQKAIVAVAAVAVIAFAVYYVCFM